MKILKLNSSRSGSEIELRRNISILYVTVIVVSVTYKVYDKTNIMNQNMAHYRATSQALQTSIFENIDGHNLKA